MVPFCTQILYISWDLKSASCIINEFSVITLIILINLLYHFNRHPFNILNMDFYAYSFIMLNTKLLNVIYSKTWKSQMVPSGNKGAIFSFLRGACVACVFRRWIERGPSLIVSTCRCTSKAVCAWFWVLNSLKKSDAHLCVGVRYSWVGVRSLCVAYAWLCPGHASAVSAYASELVQNRARPRPSSEAPPSYHDWTAHVSLHSTDVCEACVFGCALSVSHASGVRRVFVE